MNGWRKNVSILIALAESNIKFTGQIFTTTASVEVGTKSNVLLVTNIFALTTNGTTNQTTVQAVESGKKKLVPIVTAVAKSDTKNSGITNQITALAKAGTKLDVAIQIVVIQFQFTHLGQTSPNTAKTVILGTRRLVQPMGVLKRFLTSHCGATHPNTVTPAGN